LSGIPEAIAAGVCPFPSVEACCEATILTIQSAFRSRAIELLDALQVRACNAYSKLALPETPMLFLEFHGTMRACRAVAALRRDAAELGGGPFDWATRRGSQQALQARHDAYWAARFAERGRRCRRHRRVACRSSRLAQCVVGPSATSPTVGWSRRSWATSGDGNFHLTLMVDLADAARLLVPGTQRAPGGTGAGDGWDLTGRARVGQGKMAYLPAEHARPRSMPCGPSSVRSIRMHHESRQDRRALSLEGFELERF